MAEENENIIEDVSSETPEQVEQPKVEQPRDEKGQFKSKFESINDPSVAKVDLSKPPPTQENEEVEEDVVQEEEVEVVDEKPETLEEQVEEEQIEEKPIVEEISTVNTEEIKEEVKEEHELPPQPQTQTPPQQTQLPEKLQKVIQFMNETGGDLNDYVKLNRDVSKMDDSDVLDEYYRATKSHLTAEERAFLLEETYGYNDEEDSDRDIKRKKIALKEQVAEARAHLDRQKSKYYEEIKAGSKLTQQQQNAINFFNRYSKEAEVRKKKSQQAQKMFTERTNNVFNDKFKGFEYNVGDKKFRINVKNPEKVKQNQSSISNFVNRFANEDKSEIIDMQGYHKSLFTAMNADAIANHFYEQGKADAIKARVAKDKNINLEPRKTHGEINTGGTKYRVLSGESSSDIKNRSFKIRSKNKK